MPREYIDLISSDEEDEGAVSVPIIDLTSDDEENKVARTPIIDLTSDNNQASSSNTSSHHGNRALHRVNHHAIQKRSLPKRSAATSLSQHCRECSHQFISNDPPLSQRRYSDMCAGCSLLNARIKATKENHTAVKHWLCTGKLPKKDRNDKIDKKTEKERTASRVRGMKRRFKRMENGKKNNPSFQQSLPSRKDLLKMLVDQDYKCAITGWNCHFGNNSAKSWSVSFDHIVPISTAPPGFNPWVSSNIQVTCDLLNKIKGSHSDVEVHRWFNIWKDASKQKYA